MNALTQFGIPPEAADERKRPSAGVPSGSATGSQIGSPIDAQSMEAVGRLVAGVAHDFNNLLTGIMLCSDLLLAGLNEQNWLRRYAVEIRSACVNGAILVQQLSVAAGPGTTEAASLSFNDAVVEMHDLLARLIGENIQVSTDLAENLRSIKMHPAEARQIILNLALNARDAMPEGGQLTLITRNSAPASSQPNPSSPEPHIEFEVRDTGLGMDAQTRSRIFEPFFTTKSQGKGTGLGLSTVLNIATQHHGTVGIETQPGEGTSVTVTLPCEKSPISQKGTLI